MESISVGIAGVIAFFLLLGLSVHIAVALGLVGAPGLIASQTGKKLYILSL